jgi:sec-independent protein translocase protein TatA
MFRSIGPPEILLILLVVLVLFGAKRLPDLSRSMGRSLRIFKSEMKKMNDEDDDHPAPPADGTTARSDAPPAQELEGRVYRADETPVRPVPDPERRDT